MLRYDAVIFFCCLDCGCINSTECVQRHKQQQHLLIFSAPIYTTISGLFVPLHFRSRERKVHRELSLPWNFRSMEHSLLGTFAPVELSFLGSERSERLQNRYTHKIFSMDWLSGILKRVAKIFGVWLAEKGV